MFFQPNRLTESAQEALSSAHELLNRLHHQRLDAEFISTEHLLLGLAADTEATGEVLQAWGATRERMIELLPDVRGGQRVTAPAAAPHAAAGGGDAAVADAALGRAAARSEGEGRPGREGAALQARQVALTAGSDGSLSGAGRDGLASDSRTCPAGQGDHQTYRLRTTALA